MKFSNDVEKNEIEVTKMGQNNPLTVNHSILSITMGRIVLHYPSHVNSKYLVGS